MSHQDHPEPPHGWELTLPPCKAALTRGGFALKRGKQYVSYADGMLFFEDPEEDVPGYFHYVDADVVAWVLAEAKRREAV